MSSSESPFMNLSSIVRRHFISAFIFIGIILFFQGCATTERPRRGKLSEVMEKASTDYKGERRLTNPKEPDPSEFAQIKEEKNTQDIPKVQTDIIVVKEDSEKDTENDQKSENDSFFGFSGGLGLIKGNDFYEMTHVNIYIGNYINEQSRFELVLGGAWAPIQETSDLDKSLGDGVFILNLGVDYKFFATRRHTFLSPYLIIGAAYRVMYWRYENPVVTADGETIYRDYMEGYEIHAGLGLHLAQTKRFQVGGEIVPSAIFWEPTTSNGFDNDVFGPFYTMMFRVTFTLL